MHVAKLASTHNLHLAWRRITTGANYQYKRFFRHLYYAYELALDENLRDLRTRLVSLAWEPHSPDRIYLPKPSGLQRPVTLLHLEDQIVLQALANVIGERIRARRQAFVCKSVFSNLPAAPASIFFFQDWHRTYSAFSSKVTEHFQARRTWIADFDLAAFYDTICHNLLLRTAYPRLKDSDEVRWIKKCLSTWTSQRPRSSIAHGLPQGPIASDLLAEVFLLPIDEAMSSFKGYVRYVDDVRLLAETENQIREAVIQLEIHCRERGLIPQAGKFTVRQAHSLSDARGMLPSVGASGDSTDPRLTAKIAERLVRGAVGGRPLRVVDKTRFRYVFFRAKPSPRLLRLACTLLSRNPEHIDAIAAYLTQYDYRKGVRDRCLATLSTTPYEYVRGELWHILARYYTHSKAFDAKARRLLIDRAISVLKERPASTAVKWGAGHFVCAAEKRDGKPYSRFLRYQESALLQAMIAPALPRSALTSTGVVRESLSRDSIEPALALGAPMHAAGVSLASLGIPESVLPLQVARVFAQLGLIKPKKGKVDVVGEIIEKRYGVSSSGQWLKLLTPEYLHAAGILVQADVAFWSGPSHWLSHQNSFNQIVFLALQRHLSATAHPAAVRTHRSSGELLDYGVTLDANNRFSRTLPTIATAFRGMNTRRNKLPGSHPYERKTAAQTRYLKTQERNRFVGLLRAAYSDLLVLCP